MVFTWHFIHVENGQLASPPIFPLSILSEGHTGVGLFIALSGYLFAKLLDQKRIKYIPFLWNRFLRLGPLLILVIVLAGLERYLMGESLIAYAKSVFQGAVLPTLPNGGWSITVEFHFYVILPLLLFFTKKSKYFPVLVVILAILVRSLLYAKAGQVQILAYFTIIGRIDQFLLGITAYRFKDYLKDKHAFCSGLMFFFTVFYWFFDQQGGFYGGISYPSPSTIWIYMPTIEGIVYASLISWYDNSFTHSEGKVSRFIAMVGSYSYSIYLLHFFLVFRIGNAINQHIIDLSNINVAMIFSLFCFLPMIPIGYISNQYIESPFLRLRAQYIVDESQSANQAGLNM